MSSGKPKKIDLFPTSSSRTIEPCIDLIDNDKYFGLVKDEYLITVSTVTPTENDKMTGMLKVRQESTVSSSSMSGLDPKNSKTPTIAWSEPLQNFVWDEPYLIGLVTDSIEVRVMDSSGLEKENLIQVIPDLPKARFLIRGQRGLLYAASLSHLWCIQAVDLTKQRKMLLKDKKFHLALQLTVSL